MISGSKFLLFLCTVWCSNLILTAEIKSFLFFDRRWIQKISPVLEKNPKIFEHFRAQKFFLQPQFVSEFPSILNPPYASKKSLVKFFLKPLKTVSVYIFKKPLIPAVS